MFYKICKFENHIRKNDVIMMSLPKTIEKFGPPRNQTNYISFERYWLIRAIRECTFYWIWATVSKVMGIFVKFWCFFYDDRSPNMVMSRDPRCKFWNFFLFCPNSKLNIWKRQKISSGKALYFRSYQPKTSRGGGKHPLPVLLGLTLFAKVWWKKMSNCSYGKITSFAVFDSELFS